MTTVILNTSQGKIKLELIPEKTPKTVSNFLYYVENEFYNKTIFHRVIDGFMIQGGGLTENLSEKQTQEPIENEAKFGLNNQIGTIAMARTSDPHSASAQFFINVENNAFLDFKNETEQGYGYCAFGKVIEGLYVVQKISKTQTTSIQGYDDVPKTPITIHSAEVVKETV